MNRKEVREHLTGPISSVLLPFDSNGDIDFEGLRKQIEFNIQAGTRTILLTAGDSHYFCLSDNEIAEVTKVTVEQTRGRAMVVAADRLHATARAVEFARFARDAGADVVMCLPPDWGASTSPESMALHYATVAKVMPVMIVTSAFIPRGLEFALESIRLALDASQDIVAIKDDMCGNFASRLCLLAHPQCAVFAGGQKVNHMNMHPYGCDGYLSTLITFRPDITKQYWDAVTASNLPAATAIIRDYDMPLFDFLATLPGDCDAGLHGMLELYGLSVRHRRAPYLTLTDEDMEKLAHFLKSKSLAS